MMSVEEMKTLLKSRGRDVEAYLAGCLDGRAIPSRLKESMLYSLQAGGKRLRPVLCLSCAALCGLEPHKALPFASAIEMIHTYSLIHDDLPAMDDDDLRRGKPSNHKAFDEATAILAGDGLLTDAFVIMCRAPLAADVLLRAVAELALAAGASGMVGGQEWDMIYTGRSQVSLEELRGMHAMKTGALLRASCVCGGLLAGAEEVALRALGDHVARAAGGEFLVLEFLFDAADLHVHHALAGAHQRRRADEAGQLVGGEEHLFHLVLGFYVAAQAVAVADHGVDEALVAAGIFQ